VKEKIKEKVRATIGEECWKKSRKSYGEILKTETYETRTRELRKNVTMLKERKGHKSLYYPLSCYPEDINLRALLEGTGRTSLKDVHKVSKTSITLA